MSGRRFLPGWLLALVFFGVPLVEIFVLVQVGQVIGPWWTILLLLVSGVIGAWLVRHEGARTWRAFTQALSAGRMPAREIADGLLVLTGGVLMLTPGFLTDLFGVLLILPVTRPLFRRVLTRVVAARLVQTRTRPRRGHGHGPVVEGEVLDDE